MLRSNLAAVLVVSTWLSVLPAAEPVGPSRTRGAAGDALQLARFQVPMGKAAKVAKSESLGLELVLVDAGEFVMGSPAGEADPRDDAAEKVHRVKISQPFYFGKHEVTQAEYQRVMKRNPSSFVIGSDHHILRGLKDTQKFPVDSVTWFDALEFCNKLSAADDLPLHYRLTHITRAGESIDSATVLVLGGAGYRLPTEAEWEYACRAGTTTPFHFGKASNGSAANINGKLPYGTETKGVCVERPTTVGSYDANAWDLHDMHGNLWEWCYDNYAADYYPSSPPVDPPGPVAGKWRVLRGGAWPSRATASRSAYRGRSAPEARNMEYGFRVARTP